MFILFMDYETEFLPHTNWIKNVSIPPIEWLFISDSTLLGMIQISFISQAEEMKTNHTTARSRKCLVLNSCMYKGVYLDV